jgi:hypothetical protein
MRSIPRWAVPVAAAAITVTAALGTTGSGADDDPADAQHSRLLARSVLAAETFREGSPPSGAFIGAGDRATAAGNGIVGPAAPAPYFDEQPVQGVSAVIPDGEGTWFALSDNGYGSRQSSADWQLVVLRVDPRFGNPLGPEVLDAIVLSDPDQKVPWRTACDPTVGDPLPPFDFNVLPATPPAACGETPGARILTGFDFDPESMQIGADGTFWFGDEFGPFLLHTDRTGRLLDAPIGVPGRTAPQNPTLDLAATPPEQPTVASSRGFEAMAISPDRTTLYPLLEGPTGDDAQVVELREFDIKKRRFSETVRLVRLEMPGQPVNLAVLNLAGTPPLVPAYPGAVAPVGAGGQSLPELIALNKDQFVAIERDGNGDGVAAPRFKKLFLLDTKHTGDGEFVTKQLLVDLMAVPDPAHVGDDGDYFRFPFNTIESVHPVDDSTLIVADDNNFPFSNGRSRSKTADRLGNPLAPDANEFILIRLGTPLDLDGRILTPPT